MLIKHYLQCKYVNFTYMKYIIIIYVHILYEIAYQSVQFFTN